MDENKVSETLKKSVDEANGVSSTKTTTSVTPGMSDQQRVDEINRMYDANIASQKANLEATYNQNLSNAEANKEQIAKTYAEKKNQSAAGYEQQKRNFGLSAAANGINTGTYSQAQLAMGGAQQRAQAELGASEAQQTAEADRNIQNLKISYQNDINKAVTNNDYQRAAALLDEYNSAYSRAVTKAQTLSQFGDFSGYASIYGQDVADNMAVNWYANNPDMAYAMGKITSDQRDNLKRGVPMNDGLDINGRRIVQSYGGGYYGGSGGGSSSSNSGADAMEQQFLNDMAKEASSKASSLPPSTYQSMVDGKIDAVSGASASAVPLTYSMGTTKTYSTEKEAKKAYDTQQMVKALNSRLSNGSVAI